MRCELMVVHVCLCVCECNIIGMLIYIIHVYNYVYVNKCLMCVCMYDITESCEPYYLALHINILYIDYNLTSYDCRVVTWCLIYTTVFRSLISIGIGGIGIEM